MTSLTPLKVFYVIGLYFIWYYYESVAKEQESQLKKEASKRLEDISKKVENLDTELSEGRLIHFHQPRFRLFYSRSLVQYMEKTAEKVSQKHAELCEKLESARHDNEVLYRTLTRLSAAMQLQKKS